MKENPCEVNVGSDCNSHKSRITSLNPVTWVVATCTRVSPAWAVFPTFAHICLSNSASCFLETPSSFLPLSLCVWWVLWAFCCSLPDWHLFFESQPEYLYPERPSFFIPLRGLLEPQPKAVTQLSILSSTLYFIAFISYVSESLVSSKEYEGEE